MDEHALSLDLVRSELPSARARADSLFLLPLLLREGHIEAFFGNAMQAESSLREAKHLAVALADSAALTSSTRWLAVAIGAQGRMEEAQLECEELLRLARLRGDLRHEAWAHVGLAWNSEISGDWHDAEIEYEQAVNAFAEAGDAFGECWARNGLGAVQTVLGEFDLSRETLEAAVRQAKGVGYTLAEAFARTNLGRLEWSFGDPSEAEAQFRRLAALHRAAGSAREAVVLELEVARWEWTLGRMRLASARIESLLTACREKNWLDYEGKVLRHLADLRVLQSRNEDAVALYREALALESSIAADDRIECILGWSDALAADGDPEAGLAILDRHREELTEITHGEFALEFAERRGRRLLELGRPEQATRVLHPAEQIADSLGLARLRVPLEAELAQAHRELGHADSALAHLRSAREAWREERSVPKDPEWREERGATGRLVYTDLADLLLDRPVSLPSGERTKAAYAAVREFKARTLLERRLGPARAVTVGAGTDATQLHPGELLLDYYLGPRLSLLFVVSAERVEAHRLPPEDELAGRAHLLGQILATPPGPGGHERSAQTLEMALGAFRTLFPEAARARIANADRVLYSADGPLHLLPLPLIWEAAATPSDLAGDRIESAAEWCSIPSADLLAELRNEREDASPHGCSVLAFSASGDAYLPGARSEVDWLERSFQAVDRGFATECVLAESGERNDADARDDADGQGRGTHDGGPGPNLSVSDRLASWREYDVIHIASHAHTYDEAPWRSTIDCGAGSGLPEIRADEIANSRLGARLAVLSSCRSVGGRSLTGEGVQGLSSAFLAARVPVVVATLWPVDDASAAVLMRHFYEGLERGETVAGALDRARTAVRGAEGTESPFYWAGYVAIGDGAVRVPLERRPTYARWARTSRGFATAHVPILVALACWTLLVVVVLRIRTKTT
ncbi:MAG: CHAT domain-containing tetratricopeptide repeat protein [Candidatus Eisenbacteria bacterium]